jgi:hypothetical protein
MELHNPNIHGLDKSLEPDGWRRRRRLPLFLLPVIFFAGCVTLDSSTFVRKAGPPPVCQVVATWYPEVIFTADPAHNGEPSPGLGGRIYLFGPEVSCPLVGDGSIVVDLYDDTHVDKAQHPAPLEEWRIDRDTLDRLKRRDAVGWGYTVFLPWGTYRPDLVHIHLRLRYEPHDATPLYAESGPMVLRSKENAVPRAASQASTRQGTPQASPGR